MDDIYFDTRLHDLPESFSVNLSDFGKVAFKASGIDLEGSEGADIIYGTDAADRLVGRGGSDFLAGGLADDAYIVDDASDAVLEIAGQGTDTLYTVSDYALAANVSVEVLSVYDRTTTDPLQLTGNAFANTIYGNNGANILSGGGGTDTLYGMMGDDDYYVDSASDRVFEGAGGGYDTIYTTADYTLAAGSSVEALVSMSATRLFGNELSNTLVGSSRDNALFGGGGSDTFLGLAGNDAYFVDDETDLVVEFANQGFDTVYTTSTFALGLGASIEVLSVYVRSTTNSVRLYGNSDNQTIYGNAGINLLNGGGGTDVMYGLAGDDAYMVDSAGDQVVELAGQGNDTVYATASFALSGQAEIETLTPLDRTSTAALDLGGNGYGQTIYGNAGANSLRGGGGTDVFYGLGGNDAYVVDDLTDQVTELAGQGTDTVYTTGHFVLTAGSEIEVLSVYDRSTTNALNMAGNAFGQTIYGNAGNNVIDGKAGADTIFLMGGTDTVFFSTPLGGGNVDALVGFASGNDKIQLSSAIFAGLAPGGVAPGAFVLNALPADANDRLLYNQTLGQLFFDADGNGAGAAVLFATLGAGTALAASDFLVV